MKCKQVSIHVCTLTFAKKTAFKFIHALRVLGIIIIQHKFKFVVNNKMLYDGNIVFVFIFVPII